MTSVEARKIVETLINRLRSIGEDGCDYEKVTHDIGCDAKETADALELLMPKPKGIPEAWQETIRQLDKIGAENHNKFLRKEGRAIREANEMWENGNWVGPC